MGAEEGRKQDRGEAVREHQLATWGDHPSAVDQASPLIRPVVEGGGADDQIEAAVGKGKVLSDSGGESQPRISGGSGSCLRDHPWGGVDAEQFDRLWAAPG
jgi:hypothetical protein